MNILRGCVSLWIEIHMAIRWVIYMFYDSGLYYIISILYYFYYRCIHKDAYMIW